MELLREVIILVVARARSGFFASRDKMPNESETSTGLLSQLERIMDHNGAYFSD